MTAKRFACFLFTALTCSCAGSVSGGFDAGLRLQDAGFFDAGSQLPQLDAGSAWPAWRKAIAPRTWGLVSPSKMRDVDPADDPLMNPTPGDSPWRGSDGQRAIIAGWGSATWDEKNLELHVPNGGGHGNYGGNEPYKISLSADAPMWKLLRAPSGAIGNRITLADGQEATCVYADGRPRSTHTYDNLTFVPGLGPVLVRMGSAFPGSGGCNKVFVSDPASGESRLVFDFTPAAVGFPGGVMPGGTGLGYNYGSATYDSKRNRVYSLGVGGNTWLVYTTPSAAGLWQGGVVGYGGSGSSQLQYVTDTHLRLIYIERLDRLIALAGYHTELSAIIIDPDTGASKQLVLTGRQPPFLKALNGMLGASWVPERNALLLWANPTSPAVVTTLTPVDDGLSEWAYGTIAPVAGEPPAFQSNGVFGLFGCSSKLKGCYLISSVDEPVSFFALE